MKYVRRTKSLSVLCSFFALLLSSGAFATSAKAASIQSITFAGSGCPAAKDVVYSLQGDYLLISFGSSLKAEVGPGVTLSSLRKNCSATLVFGADQKSLAVHSVGWYGLADLKEGQDANLNVSWFYQGQGTTGSFNAVLKGTGRQPWLNNFEGQPTAEVWEPCDASRALTINTSLRIAGPRDQVANSQLYFLGVRFKSRNC